jgi:hypothetical protein
LCGQANNTPVLTTKPPGHRQARGQGPRRQRHIGC